MKSLLGTLAKLVKSCVRIQHYPSVATVVARQQRLQQRRWISAAQLTVEKRADDGEFNKCPAKEDLVFGTTLSDHMLVAGWDTQNQWGAPKIVPYENLSISPAASCLHYGTIQTTKGTKEH